MRQKLMLAVALCGAVGVSACATRASNVAPVSISSTDYAALSCDRAVEQLDVARQKTNALARRQNNAAVMDAASVFLVLLPLGSVFGASAEGELAQAKGEQLALERHVSQRCPAS